MIYYVNHIKDTIGNYYLGIDIPTDSIKPFLNQLKDVLGDRYDEYIQLQKTRDHDKYHITVINTMEYNKISKDMGVDRFAHSLDYIFKYPIDDIRFLGIGTAQRNENQAFFIVCNSEKLNAVRNRYDLGPYDFHVTLGFRYKDVFGVRKNEVMKKSSNFLKLLANEYYKNENWNFIKKIGNYYSDTNAEIIPLQISDFSIKVKCDGDFLDVIYLEDQFWIGAKYAANKDLPRLSENEIAKLLKNK